MTEPTPLPTGVVYALWLMPSISTHHRQIVSFSKTRAEAEAEAGKHPYTRTLIEEVPISWVSNVLLSNWYGVPA